MARDWRRHRDFLSCHRLSFRKIKRYFLEMEEVSGDKGSRETNKKNKAPAKNDRPMFESIVRFHEDYDDLVNQYISSFEIKVVNSKNKVNAATSGMDKKMPKQPKKEKNSKIKNLEKEKQVSFSLEVNNISWKYLLNIPFQEIDVGKGSFDSFRPLKSKTAFPDLTPLVKTDVWTRIHCLNEFDPILTPLREMDVPANPSSSNNPSSHFKLGTPSLNTEEYMSSKKVQSIINPWGANASGVTDYYHPPNEFVFWLSSCLQGIVDNQMDSVETEGSSFLNNIFPQEDGRPVVSETGEYWVRLNFMGKKVKVKVDDRLPVDVVTGDLMVPLTERGEIWPALYTKAICKLFGVGMFYPILQEQKTVAEQEIIAMSLFDQKRVSKMVRENPEILEKDGKLSINSSLYMSTNLANSDLMTVLKRDSQKEPIKSENEHESQEKENMLNLLKKNMQKQVIQLEDLIANIDVVHTVTGYVPLSLNTKNWDAVFYSKFCEAISEENRYENKLKIFGLKQNKVMLTSFRKKTTALCPNL